MFPFSASEVLSAFSPSHLLKISFLNKTAGDFSWSKDLKAWISVKAFQLNFLHWIVRWICRAHGFSVGGMVLSVRNGPRLTLSFNNKNEKNKFFRCPSGACGQRRSQKQHKHEQNCLISMRNSINKTQTKKLNNVIALTAGNNMNGETSGDLNVYWDEVKPLVYSQKLFKNREYTALHLSWVPSKSMCCKWIKYKSKMKLFKLIFL